MDSSLVLLGLWTLSLAILIAGIIKNSSVIFWIGFGASETCALSLILTNISLYSLMS